MAGDIQVKREIVLEADAETLQRMRKEGMLGASRFTATKANVSAGIIPLHLRWPTSASR